MYEINDEIKEKFYKYTDKNWKWVGGKSKNGYGHLWYKGKTLSSHKISYLIHKGEVPAGMCVLHSCDTKDCVNPEHLHLGTRADNNRERAERGRNRNQNGEKNNGSKLTRKQVLEIRKRHKNGAIQRQLSKEYGVSPCQINLIVKRINWKHI